MAFFKKKWVQAVLALLLGGSGMGGWQGLSTLYDDWRFLHQARLFNEQQAQHPRPAPPVVAPVEK